MIAALTDPDSIRAYLTGVGLPVDPPVCFELAPDGGKDDYKRKLAAKTCRHGGFWAPDFTGVHPSVETACVNRATRWRQKILAITT